MPPPTALILLYADDRKRVVDGRVKGKQFSVPELLGHDDRFEALQNDTGCMLSIARLAPQVRCE